MTDNEIIKALENAIIENNDCYAKKIQIKVINLIKRQKAEIERLHKVHEKEVKRIYDDNKTLMQYYRDEVIKDFAERLKEKFGICDCIVTVDSADIENLVKEMTEGE